MNIFQKLENLAYHTRLLMNSMGSLSLFYVRAHASTVLERSADQVEGSLMML